MAYDLFKFAKQREYQYFLVPRISCRSTYSLVKKQLLPFISCTSILARGSNKGKKHTGFGKFRSGGLKCHEPKNFMTARVKYQGIISRFNSHLTYLGIEREVQYQCESTNLRHGITIHGHTGFGKFRPECLKFHRRW